MQSARASGVQRGPGALMRGLQILRLLVEAPAPMSATDLAGQVGIHHSSVSRVLSTLAKAGYVRKADYRSFEPDFGVLGLGAAASTRFDLIRKPRTAMVEAAETCSGLEVSLCMLWRGQMIYFLRTIKGFEPIPFLGGGYPLHMSSPALRIMMDMDHADAIDLLRKSRKRYGWEQPTTIVPDTEHQVLTAARARFEHDCVIFEGWVADGHVSAAINVHTSESHPVALALTGPRTIAVADTIRLWLHEIRRSVEASLNDEP